MIAFARRTEVYVSLLKTLHYARVFSYALSLQQIHDLLISDKPVSFAELQQEIDHQICSGLLVCDATKTYFALKADAAFIAKRKYRLEVSLRKRKTAKRWARLLALIPCIQCVGLSGSTSMLNAEENDDIDLFIITQENTLWFTRFVVTTILSACQVLRRADHDDVRNKLCLNMFIDTGHLGLPHNERDLFSAHEIVQVNVLVNKNLTYECFLTANSWIKTYLANIRLPAHLKEQKSKRLTKWHVNAMRLIFPLNLLAKNTQLMLMNKKRTTEIIQNGYVRFHPHDARNWIISRYYRYVNEWITSEAPVVVAVEDPLPAGITSQAHQSSA